MFKNLKGPPFTVFGIVRFLKRIIFVLKLGFLRPSTLSDFFQRPFFLCDFFSNPFSSKPPSIFTRNETFCEHKGLLKAVGTIRLTGDLHQKIFEKFSLIFCFLKCFRLRKMFFLLFPVGEEWFLRFMRIPSGIFWRCKIDEVLTIMSFYPWFSV